jgi:hypothetical protein
VWYPIYYCMRESLVAWFYRYLFSIFFLYYSVYHKQIGCFYAVYCLTICYVSTTGTPYRNVHRQCLFVTWFHAYTGRQNSCKSVKNISLNEKCTSNWRHAIIITAMLCYEQFYSSNQDLDFIGWLCVSGGVLNLFAAK